MHNILEVNNILRRLLNEDEKSLDLTFDDLKEYYTHFNGSNAKFEAIEGTEVDGATYLIYKLDDEYYARNTDDSI